MNYSLPPFAPENLILRVIYPNIYVSDYCTTIYPITVLRSISLLYYSVYEYGSRCEEFLFSAGREPKSTRLYGPQSRLLEGGLERHESKFSALENLYLLIMTLPPIPWRTYIRYATAKSCKGDRRSILPPGQRKPFLPRQTPRSSLRLRRKPAAVKVVVTNPTVTHRPRRRRRPLHQDLHQLLPPLLRLVALLMRDFPRTGT